MVKNQVKQPYARGDVLEEKTLLSIEDVLSFPCPFTPGLASPEELDVASDGVPINVVCDAVMCGPAVLFPGFGAGTETIPPLSPYLDCKSASAAWKSFSGFLEFDAPVGASGVV